MAIMLGCDALQGVLDMRETMDLLERMLSHEAAGRTFAAPKFTADFEGGALRMLFAADYEAGYFATKAYHTVKGTGARYVVSLYRLADGALLALLDGELITDLRTGAASGVIARRVPLGGDISVGIVGSGHQASMQLASLAAVYRIGSATVYSPTPAHRAAFAKDMSRRFGFQIRAADSVEAAVRGRTVVATASSSRSSEPLLRGEWLAGCRLLCAVGNTRPYAAEADVQTFRDARLVVVDTPHAMEEAGELREAVKAGALPKDRQASLAQIATGAVAVPPDGLVVFKSVGSALQDLALAARFYELLGDRAVASEPQLASARRPARAGAAGIS